MTMGKNALGVNPESLGAALMALEDGDYPGLCEVCWGAMVQGVCSDCLRPRRSLPRRVLAALWEAIRRDWRGRKAPRAEAQERERLSKVVS